MKHAIDNGKNNIKLPNFLIIGAAKSGTTALYEMIGQHPDVFMPTLKEPRFFLFTGNPDHDPKGPIHEGAIKEWDAYLGLFRGAGEHKAAGEASGYLHNADAIPRIKRRLGIVKIVVILRNPAERAFSHFLHFLREGWEETDDFEAALERPTVRKGRSIEIIRNYVPFGFYYKQLVPYYDAFGERNLKVVLHEDLKENPDATVRSVFRHLEVDEEVQLNLSNRPNISGVPAGKIWHAAYLGVRRPPRVVRKAATFLPSGWKSLITESFVKWWRENRQVRPSMPTSARERLRVLYRDDIGKLEGLIQRDVSDWWKEPGNALEQSEQSAR